MRYGSGFSTACGNAKCGVLCSLLFIDVCVCCIRLLVVLSAASEWGRVLRTDPAAAAPALAWVFGEESGGMNKYQCVCDACLTVVRML